MPKLKTGLGRGLSALIENATQERGNDEFVNQPSAAKAPDGSSSQLVSIQEIEIDKIVPNPYQPRTEFAQEKLDELAESIKMMGLIQPITVTKNKAGKYQIISGERRFRASSAAGLKTIPAYIKDVSEDAMLEMALVENIQREDLDPIDVALSFQRLIDECSLTQEALSQRVGKNRATVANFLRLLKLPPEIQFAIKAKKISMGHAKALLGLEKDTTKLKLANQIIEYDLSVRQTEEKVKKLNGGMVEKEKKDKNTAGNLAAATESGRGVAEILQKYFKDSVAIKPRKKGAGDLTIHYQSDTQLEDFLKALKEHNL
jgi:ParB family chromosome partitioning protein